MELGILDLHRRPAFDFVTGFEYSSRRAQDRAERGCNAIPAKSALPAHRARARRPALRGAARFFLCEALQQLDRGVARIQHALA
ncbi:MAG TPA: hypothetical protein VLT92_15260, partial [Burkholderiales bacterium]|nr:hypothetical protein [Burkholderiales bacterium]